MSSFNLSPSLLFVCFQDRVVCLVVVSMPPTLMESYEKVVTIPSPPLNFESMRCERSPPTSLARSASMVCSNF
jgi:hypothetical protein